MVDSTQRVRAKKKLIRVTFPDGRVICYGNTTDTMIAVLVAIGSDKFASIDLELCHLPLLSRVVYPKLEEWMKPVCDGWYLNAQSNSEQKYLQLRSINDKLGLGLVIELGSDLVAEKGPLKDKKSRTKDKLLVKFPDGEYVAGESVLETFLQTMWQLGLEDIKRKNLMWGGHDLITTTKITNTQVQVGENLWIVVPNTSKDKIKLLRVVAAMLHINLEISLI
ncbi:MAG: hypothetical protein ACI4B4_14640 [Segatella copri]